MDGVRIGDGYSPLRNTDQQLNENIQQDNEIKDLVSLFIYLHLVHKKVDSCSMIESRSSFPHCRELEADNLHFTSYVSLFAETASYALQLLHFCSTLVRRKSGAEPLSTAGPGILWRQLRLISR
jgi:hypothetical protein